MVTVIMSIFHERRAQRVNGILRWPFKITGLPKFLGGLNLVVSSRENLVPQRSCVAALTLSVLLLSVAGVSAANNWYVVPGGAGNKGGTAWTNAWDVSSISWSSVGAGDTIWLAGGTYSNTLAVGKSGSAGSPIYIKRVLASDHAPTNSPGWSSSFDSRVILPSISDPSYSYIDVDGRISYGIQVKIPSDGGAGITLENTSTVTQENSVNFYNMEVLGIYANSNASYEVDGFVATYQNSSYVNSIISNCWMHGLGCGIHSQNWSNIIVDHCIIADLAPDGRQHVDIDFHYPSPLMFYRSCIFSNTYADGIYTQYGTGETWIYNCVFYTVNVMVSLGEPGKPGGCGPFYVINNTFYSPSTSAYGYVKDDGTNVLNYNNVYYNTIYGNAGTDPSLDGYNAYNSWSYSGYSEPASEVGFVGNITSSAFVNLSGGDFNLKTNSVLIGKGTNLTALANSRGFNINIDFNGNPRPATGNWDIGAYEYSGSVSSTNLAPPAPQGLLARMSLNITNYASLMIRASGIATNWASSLHFNFGDGGYTDFGNTNVASTIHTYASPGIYTVTLIASNNVSAISSISQVTTVTQ